MMGNWPITGFIFAPVFLVVSKKKSTLMGFEGSLIRSRQERRFAINRNSTLENQIWFY